MKTDNYMKGAMAGGVIGFGYAAWFRKNIVISVLIGTVAGGYISNLITSKKTITKTKFKKPTK